ncbi:MAG: cyclic nucleotide-binding domain-containing protein [Bdellovibrionales bacterium]
MNFLWENFFRKGQKNRTLAHTLSETFLFEDLTSREINLLLNTVHVRKYRPGEYIFRQGEAGVGMYIIVEGNVDIATEDERAKEPDASQENSYVTRLKPGDFFGELALVEKKSRRSASAISCGESTLIGFFKPDLVDLTERSPSTGVKIVNRLSEVLGRRLRETTTKITELRRQLEYLKPKKSNK